MTVKFKNWTLFAALLLLFIVSVDNSGVSELDEVETDDYPDWFDGLNEGRFRRSRNKGNSPNWTSLNSNTADGKVSRPQNVSKQGEKKCDGKIFTPKKNETIDGELVEVDKNGTLLFQNGTCKYKDGQFWTPNISPPASNNTVPQNKTKSTTPESSTPNDNKTVTREPTTVTTENNTTIIAQTEPTTTAENTTVTEIIKTESTAAPPPPVPAPVPPTLPTAPPPEPVPPATTATPAAGAGTATTTGTGAGPGPGTSTPATPETVPTKKPYQTPAKPPIQPNDPEPVDPSPHVAEWKGTTFTCDALPEDYKECSEVCEQLKLGADSGDGGAEGLWLLIVGIVWLLLAIIVYIGYRYKQWKSKKKVVSPVATGAEAASTIKLRAALTKATEQATKQEKKDKSVEEPSIPSVKNTDTLAKMRAKLLQTQANLDKLRKHVKKSTAQHKSDTRSSKFEKKGAIFIPKEPPIPPAAVLPDGIILENVTYDPKLNEMWDIGSDVDDIELDESFRLNPESLTEDEASQKSESKKVKNGDEKKKDATKTGDEVKTTTDPPPKEVTKEEKKEKSVEHDKSQKKDKSKKDKTKST